MGLPLLLYAGVDLQKISTQKPLSNFVQATDGDVGTFGDITYTLTGGGTL